jgi:hypothetical protein
LARHLGPDERLHAALGYAARGLHVLPLHHPVGREATLEVGCSCGELACGQVGDHPLPPGGAADATGDPDRIRWWWRRFPFANVGLATGVHFDVLDVQGASADTFRWSLAIAALRAGGPLVRTGGDGWQFFLRPLGLGDLRTRRLPRVAWRGLGGWVAAPPSRHPSGAVATWVHDLDTPLPETPEALHGRLGSPSGARPLPRPSHVRPFVRLKRAVGSAERIGLAISPPPVVTMNTLRPSRTRD